MTPSMCRSYLAISTKFALNEGARWLNMKHLSNWAWTILRCDLNSKHAANGHRSWRALLRPVKK